MLEQGARADSTNNFQARYAIRHPWTGPIACANPQRGRWGGQPGGVTPPVQPAEKIGFVDRSGPVTLGSFLGKVPAPETFLSRQGDPTLLAELAAPGAAVANQNPPVTPYDPPKLPAAPPSAPATKTQGCAGCTALPGDAAGASASAALIALGLAALRRRRR
jgi:uncharacterized protein (TIGR03382 family)